LEYESLFEVRILVFQLSNIFHRKKKNRVDAWSENTKHLVDELSDAEVEHFSRWFAEEFYPVVDYWKVKIGWPGPTDLFLQPFVTIDWRGPEKKYHGMVPRKAGEYWYSVSVENFYAKEKEEEEYCPEMIVPLRAWPGGEVDVNPLIQIHWVTKLWEWESRDSDGSNMALSMDSHQSQKTQPE